jgi:uncharacterized protein YifE (UPF0438 family)
MSAVPNPQNQNPLVAAVASMLPSITKAEEPKPEAINLQPQAAPAAPAPASKPKKKIISLSSIRNESEVDKPKDEKVGTWDEQVRKAKDNLSSRHDKKPSAADVASLAGLRYHGKDNTSFLQGYNTRKGEEAEAEPETKTKSKRVKPVRVTAEAGTHEEKVENFFKNRVKNPAQFTYTPEGDLRIQGVEGVADSTIVLKAYTALKPEELKELEDKRLEALVLLEEEYEATLTELRATHESYKSGETGAARVVEVNQKLRDVTLKISQAAYPERWIKYVDNPEIRKILLGEIYEQRKLGYDVSLVKRSDLSRRDVWGRYRDLTIEVAEEQNQQSGGSNDVIFIEDEETPFHPAFMREFVYEETRYVSPYQAYQAERFKELDLPEIKNQILKTRSARTIHNIAAKEPTDVKYPKELWEQILEAYYTQHKDLGTRLKDTGSKRFHLSEAMYANQNYLDALLATRVMLRESGDVQAEIKEVKEGVITEEQQKRNRAGAIANFRRH